MTCVVYNPDREIKQMSGRAGRSGFDTYGEAVVIARNENDKRYLRENHIDGEPEKVDSRLAGESILRSHILASMAGIFCYRKKSFRKGV